MASESTQEKYRKKVADMDDSKLDAEIAGLEDKLLRVREELYQLDTSPESLSEDRSFKSKRSSRINNQRNWDERLDIAISELESRGRKYVPGEGMAEVYEVAAALGSTARIVFLDRQEDGKASGYDIIVSDSAPDIGSYPVKLTTARIVGEPLALLRAAVMNNRVYEWHPKYMAPNGGRRLWTLDFYTSDGRKVGFKGNVYHPYNYEQIRFIILMSVATQFGYERMRR